MVLKYLDSFCLCNSPVGVVVLEYVLAYSITVDMTKKVTVLIFLNRIK